MFVNRRKVGRWRQVERDKERSKSGVKRQQTVKSEIEYFPLVKDLQVQLQRELSKKKYIKV